MTVDGVVVAAGLSSRAGGFKPEFALHGQPLIHHTVGTLLPYCDRIIVVGGYKFERLQSLLDGYRNITLLRNREYRSGMFSSVRVGVEAVEAERFFFLPGDIPAVHGKVPERLLQVSSKVVIPAFQGRKGHPVLFDSCVIPTILNAPVSSNLRSVIHDIGYTTLEVEDKNILQDVDTIQDYRELKGR